MERKPDLSPPRSEAATLNQPVRDPPAAKRGLARGDLVGRYVVIQELGAGGMGVVHLAYDPELDRKVAIKLLRPERSGEDARTRLLREAQAMARLSHPNVIAVHDVGTRGDEVFIAMEFVQGRSLGACCGEGDRSWKEVVGLFAAAGRGLAAAHEAGLVHRDFKPGNVIVGDDGRPRVLDFGLARAAEMDAEQALEPEPTVIVGAPAGEDVLGERKSSPLATPLTGLGSMLGTPAYMAPEQLRGEPVDARADQYSFCVALYEVLYGERPIGGGTLPEFLAQVAAGEIRPEPAGSHVPSWLRRVLLRGLSVDPQHRYPSMRELLAAISADPAAGRRRWIAAAAIALIALLGWWGSDRSRDRTLCRGAEEKLVEVWDADRKASIEASFAAVGAPFAGSAWQGVARSLDQRAGEWVAMRTEACEATHLRGEQSAELLDLRMYCLDRQLGELRALTDLLAGADAAIVEHAVQAVHDLTPLRNCTDLRALRSGPRPPGTPEARARLAAARAELADAHAHLLAGKYREGLERARRGTESAADLAYPPLAAEAHFLVGQLLEKAGDYAGAREVLFRALASAVEGGDDILLTRTAALQARLEALLLGKPDEGRRWGGLASAGLARAAVDPATEVEVLSALGVVEYAAGDLPAARDTFAQALEKQRETFGEDQPATADLLHRLGVVANDSGRQEEALELHRKTYELRLALFGPDHPLVAESLNGLGNVFTELGRQDEAAEHYKRALGILERSMGDHPNVAGYWNNLGVAYTAGGRLEEALDAYGRALEAFSRALGPENPSVAMCLVNLGEVYLKTDRYDQALTSYRRALEIDEKALGPDHPDVAYDLNGMGAALVGLGRPQEAVGILERGVRLRESHEVTPAMLAEVRFQLARALWDAAGDRHEALRLARLARDGYASYGEKTQDDVVRVEAWLTERGVRAPTGRSEP